MRNATLKERWAESQAADQLFFFFFFFFFAHLMYGASNFIGGIVTGKVGFGGPPP